MKNLILLLLLLTSLVSAGQIGPTVKEVIAQSDARRALAAAESSANSARTANIIARANNSPDWNEKNSYAKINIDYLKNTSHNFKYIVIQSVTGWMILENFLSLNDRIKGADKYLVVSLNSLELYLEPDIQFGITIGRYVTSHNKKNIKLVRQIQAGNLYEPLFPDKYLNDSETLFLHWSRENLGGENRFSTLVLKDSMGKTMYEAEYQNLAYSQMLKPLLNDYISNKQDAKKELLELKEYLDLGIITQEEFDEKSIFLKKILLGNQ